MLSFKYLRNWIFPLPLRSVVALRKNAFYEWSSHSELWNISVGVPCLPKPSSSRLFPSFLQVRQNSHQLWIITIHFELWPCSMLMWHLQPAFLFSGAQQPSVHESRVRNSSFLQIQRDRRAVQRRKKCEKEINEEFFKWAGATIYPERKPCH